MALSCILYYQFNCDVNAESVCCLGYFTLNAILTATVIFSRLALDSVCTEW